MKKQTKRGGKRQGAGRPRKAPTKIISFRVPSETAPEIKKHLQTIINNL